MKNYPTHKAPRTIPPTASATPELSETEHRSPVGDRARSGRDVAADDPQSGVDRRRGAEGPPPARTFTLNSRGKRS